MTQQFLISGYCVAQAPSHDLLICRFLYSSHAAAVVISSSSFAGYITAGEGRMERKGIPGPHVGLSLVPVCLPACLVEQRRRHDLEEINYNKTLQFMLNQLLQLRCCSGGLRQPSPGSSCPSGGGGEFQPTRRRVLRCLIVQLPSSFSSVAATEFTLRVPPNSRVVHLNL